MLLQLPGASRRVRVCMHNVGGQQLGNNHHAWAQGGACTVPRCSSAEQTEHLTGRRWLCAAPVTMQALVRPCLLPQTAPRRSWRPAQAATWMHMRSPRSPAAVQGTSSLPPGCGSGPRAWCSCRMRGTLLQHEWRHPCLERIVFMADRLAQNKAASRCSSCVDTAVWQSSQPPLGLSSRNSLRPFFKCRALRSLCAAASDAAAGRVLHGGLGVVERLQFLRQ